MENNQFETEWNEPGTSTFSQGVSVKSIFMCNFESKPSGQHWACACAEN